VAGISALNTTRARDPNQSFHIPIDKPLQESNLHGRLGCCSFFEVSVPPTQTKPGALTSFERPIDTCYQAWDLGRGHKSLIVFFLVVLMAE